MENRKEPQVSGADLTVLSVMALPAQALQYLFRLVDIRGQGYLDAFTLNYFFRVSWWRRVTVYLSVQCSVRLP